MRRETLICDTSFVSHLLSREEWPDRNSHWRAADIARIRTSLLAISIVTISEWTAAKARGVAVGDNDLWIAATAALRGQALVTCDRDHVRLAPDLPIEVMFLAPPV